MQTSYKNAEIDIPLR